MKIYTKTGDKGQTSLANGQRVPKTDLRIEAYGTSDELNSFVGMLRVTIDELVKGFNFKVNTYKFIIPGTELQEHLTWIQSRLFDLGACLAGADMHIGDEAIARLETWMDQMQTELEPLRAFVLPAGNEGACRCHVCRTVTRRLERCMLACEKPEEWHNELVFVNRLSDYFFTLARYIMTITGEKEEIWQKE